LDSSKLRDRVYQAVNILATEAGIGRTCYLFLFYHALGAFVAGEWDDLDVAPPAGRPGDPPPWHNTLSRSFELSNAPSLYELLDRARRADGTLTVYACSNSTHYLGLEPADVKQRVDEIVGLATMLEISAGADPVLYL
jgi:peroxiredoxin family protein